MSPALGGSAFSCLLLLCACGSLMESDAPAGQEEATSSSWTISATADPMTDESSDVARRLHEGTLFDVEITAECRSSGDVVYTLTAFDKQGAPAPMRVSSFVGSGGLVTFVPYTLRVDAEEARALRYYSPEYNNQIKFDGLMRFGMTPLSPEGVSEIGVAAGRRVLVRLKLAQGEELVELDQFDPRLKSVLSRCTEHYRELQEVEEAEIASRRFQVHSAKDIALERSYPELSKSSNLETIEVEQSLAGQENRAGLENDLQE